VPPRTSQPDRKRKSEAEEETMPGPVEPGGPVDAEARANVGRNESPVEPLPERRRQPVQLLE
jgi:hypothetical protein